MVGAPSQVATDHDGSPGAGFARNVEDIATSSHDGQSAAAFGRMVGQGAIDDPGAVEADSVIANGCDNAIRTDANFDFDRALGMGVFDGVGDCFTERGEEVAEVVFAYAVRAREIDHALANDAGEVWLRRNPEVEDCVVRCHHSFVGISRAIVT